MYRIAFFSFAIFCILNSATGLAEEKSKPLQIISMDFPPFVYQEDSEIKGFNVDILQAIFKDTGYTPEIRLYPWKRCLEMIKTGKADALFPLLKTADRAEYTDFSDPFTSEDTALFVLKDSGIKWTGSINDLKQYRFGRVRGYSSGPAIDYLIETGELMLDEVNKTENNIRKLLGGRYQIMIEERHVAMFYLRKMNRLKDVRLLAIVQKNMSHLGFSKQRDRTDLIIKFNAGLKRITESGDYDRIVSGYIQSESRP